MNASTGRRQTTKGMWLSRCVRPSLFIMDVEGSDGRERGEDDTSFEKQGALFALTISDLMMVNMWLRDIGREQGGSIPLLRTVFRERAKLEPGRTKVLVVIRGYDNETPFNTLVDDVVTNMEELWKSIHDQPGRPRVLFRDYIEVSVVALPDKIQEQKFKREPGLLDNLVAKLREWFAKNSLVGFRQDKVSASDFSFSAKGIWEAIRQNKRLNLPAHRVMVSSFFCEKVVKESINSLESNEDYLSLKKGVQSSPKEFSEKLGALLKSLLTHFDTETELYEAQERAAKRQELEDGVLQQVEPICRDLLYALRLRTSSESKDKITNLFSNADDPSTIVDQSVEDCLKKYIESCEDLRTRYKNLCDENCKVLKSELLSFAKIMAERIKYLFILFLLFGVTVDTKLKEFSGLEVPAGTTQLAVDRWLDMRIRVEAEHARDEAEQKAERVKAEAALAKEEADREAERAKEETERLIEQARKEAEQAKQEADKRAREAELAATNNQLNNPLMGLGALIGAIGRGILFGPAGMVGMGGGMLGPTMQNQYGPATGRGFQPPYPTPDYGYEPPYPPTSHAYGAPNPSMRPGYNPPAQSYSAKPIPPPRNPANLPGLQPAKPIPPPRNPANLPGLQPAKPIPPPRNPANLPGSQPAKPIPPPRNPANLPGSQPAKPIPPPRQLPK
ncbi:Protein ROOT HAIR DEFECTIVE 1 [Ananas comosus]|uniref:Protein ROOT HAIR DEFECTIVE 1 n=1 Tax=Ananas comosus TaxID=4615 RepID=A0A199VEV8_ANACO|nr:Protein ROOT HAIR DEFECTIVE 1 [Ananas comosus]